ncbi:hypothetical protein C6B38_08575 [Spiroplasma sp. ChiS]|uniref:hypothetical protein n=1 Tax=Spiroplasma sp. ChiS TaxID=2099885 RepID=UPI000CF91847|nr:hypothetical protein [Spiroplasma sp. ChiS]PQP78035.1 hypothetical protein C6B38_08575 [Spiroplasma sp. ChiS]
MIENLLFKNNLSKINLKEKIYFTILKTQFNQQLEEFAKVTMDFWHYYQLETYNNGNLVFKLNQYLFNHLLSYFKNNIIDFMYIFEFLFNSYQRSLQKSTFWDVYKSYSSIFYNANWIKNQKYLILEIKNIKEISTNIWNFGYHGLGYAFWIIRPQSNKENSGYDNNGRWFLSRKIEFKLI